jgi:hypothetical protein
MVEAAQVAAAHDPRWKAELSRLAPRLGRNKAIVAIARKMLVVVWHVLSKHEPDRLADPKRVARKFMEFGYRIGTENRTGTAAEFVRLHMDNIGLGQELEYIQSGKKRIPLPPSRLRGSSP